MSLSRLTTLFLIAGLCGPVAHLAARADNPRDAMLSSVADLAQRIDRKDPTLVVLQVGPLATYDAGHVRGARRATMTAFTAPMDMSGNALATELPTDDALRATLSSLGITPHTHVVLVESDNNYAATTRIYLTLVHAGLGANTTLLDGGLTAWKAAGHPTSTDVPAPTKSDMPALRTVQVTVDVAYVQAHEKTPGTVILDVRSPAAWNGLEAVDRNEAPQRFGHIPSAKSLPFPKLWDDARSALRPAEELEKIFAEAGVKPGDTIVGYCYIGQNATATIFAARSPGYTAYLYDGSMDEWSKLKLPLEMPANKGGGR